MKNLLIIIFILISSIAIGQQTKFAQRSDVKIGDSATNTASWIGKYASPYWVWTNYLGKGDTVLIVATKYDLDTLASNIVYNESDPIFALDSANILHWYDSVLRIATKYDLDTLAANIVYIETDPIFALDSNAILHWYDSILKIATKYDIDTLTFLRSFIETDPKWAEDSANVVHWGDTVAKIATYYSLDTLSFLRSESLFINDSANLVHFVDTTTTIATQYDLSQLVTVESDPIWIGDSSQYRTKSNHDSLSLLDEKSYNSLTDKPTIPVGTDYFAKADSNTNANATTKKYVDDGLAGKQATGSYEVTTNKTNVTGTSTTLYATQNLVKSYPDSIAALLERKSDTALNVRAYKFDAAGDLLVADGNNSYTKLAKGANQSVLKMWSGVVGWHADSVGAGGSGVPADSLAWVKGTTDVYLRDLNDNVGMGTTAPINKLDVRGGANIYTNQDSLKFWVDKTATDMDGDSGITVLPNGNVGIGTTAPGTKLEVNGSFKANGIGQFIAASSGIWNPSLSVSGTTDGDVYRISQGRNSSYISSWVVGRDGGANSFGAYSAFELRATDQAMYERLRILSNGNVGIGTTAPLNKLDVRGGANIYTNQDSINLWTSKAAPDLDGDSGITVLPSGNVGIGESAPYTINSSVSYFPNAIPKLEILTGSSSGSYEECVVIRHNQMDANAGNRRVGLLLKGSYESSVDESNKMSGIIWESSSAYANSSTLNLLHFNQPVFIANIEKKITMPGVYATVVGGTNRDLYIDNSGLIGYVSSTNASKEKITNIEKVNWLYKLRPVNFIYKTDTSKSKQYGLVAEEVDTIQPAIISYDYKTTVGTNSTTTTTKEIATVNYSRLVVPILKAVQDHQAEIDTLNRLLETQIITPDTNGIRKAQLAKTMYISLSAPVVMPKTKQIANGTDGQEITLIGMHNTNNITLHDGDNVQLTTATVTLKKFQTLTLIYAAPLKTWVEKSRSLN